LKLPGGGNFHATIASPGWWTDRLLAARAEGGPRLFAFLFEDDSRRAMLEV
jgi:hypothetical protein